ncbi:MAG: FTR1 family protein [Sphingobacteriia bacterium]|nr:FTR1 family protein [Sphingobacteriia bacterium]
MISIGLIIFREMLEIVLMLCVVLSATKSLPNRNQYLAAGAGAGVLLSILLTYMDEFFNNSFGGMGQELINGIALITTSVMMGATVIWMSKNAVKTGANIKHVAKAVETGHKTPWSLSYVVAMIIFREGAEIVIYVTSLISATKINGIQIALASIVATGLAITCGVLFYYGTNTVLKKYLFPISNWLIIIIAAGLSAQAASFFIAAGVLPEIVSTVWDIGRYIKFDDIISNTFGLSSYMARPSLTELMFFVGTLGGLSYMIKNQAHKKEIKA